MEFAIVVGYFLAFGGGYICGKWRGYLDAQPERDKTGRFKKKD